MSPWCGVMASIVVCDDDNGDMVLGLEVGGGESSDNSCGMMR